MIPEFRFDTIFLPRAIVRLVFVTAALLPFTSAAQGAPQAQGPEGSDTSASSAATRTAPNTFFLEAGGPGILYSVNYDRMLGEMFSIRVGATYFRFHELHDDSAGYLYAPLVANVLLGSASHKFEGGVGLEPGWAFGFRAGDLSGFQLIEVALAGYRYAPRAGGLTFRANVELLHLNSGFLPWAGIGVGYGF